MIGAIKYVYIGTPPRFRRIQDVDDVTQLVQNSGSEAIRLAHDLASRIQHLREVEEGGDYFKARSIRRRLRERVTKWVADYGVPESHAELVGLAQSAPPLLDFIAAVNPSGGLSALLSKDRFLAKTTLEVDRSDIRAVAVDLAAKSGRFTLAELRANWTGGSRMAGKPDKQIWRELLATGEYAYVGEGEAEHLEDYLTGDLYARRDLSLIHI